MQSSNTEYAVKECSVPHKDSASSENSMCGYLYVCVETAYTHRYCVYIYTMCVCVCLCEFELSEDNEV